MAKYRLEVLLFTLYVIILLGLYVAVFKKKETDFISVSFFYGKSKII